MRMTKEKAAILKKGISQSLSSFMITFGVSLLMSCGIANDFSGLKSGTYTRILWTSHNQYAPDASNKFVDIKTIDLVRSTSEYQGITTREQDNFDVYVWLKQNFGPKPRDLYLNFCRDLSYRDCEKSSKVEYTNGSYYKGFDPATGYHVYVFSVTVLRSERNLRLSYSFVVSAPEGEGVWRHSNDGGDAYVVDTVRSSLPCTPRRNEQGAVIDGCE